MATHSSTEQRRTSGSSTDGAGWYGWFVFAGIMMILLGAWHAMLGLLAIFQEDYYLVGTGGLMITADYSTWGWVHLILGAVVAAAGVGLLSGAMWSRVVAVIFALVSSLVNLAFLAAYPLWSAIMIGVNITVIFAVTAHGDAARDRW